MALPPPLIPLPPERDPAHLLALARERWGGQQDLWVFGYASLIWRPDFEFVERRFARVHGWHRALEMRSRINRGTPELPGLVFALVSGGSCQGVVYRIARERVAHELPLLWDREMPNSVYDPKWLACKTPEGEVSALAFTLRKTSPNYTGRISDAQMLEILAHAKGRYGTTLDYLLDTAHALKSCGIHDKEIERLALLARSSGLVR